MTTATIAKAATEQIKIPEAIHGSSQSASFSAISKEIHQKFETLMTPTSKPVALSQLKLGDILNWNAGYGGKRSHVVFFVKNIDETSCVVFEATRSDKKDYEGVLIRELSFAKEPLQFVLRPRTFK